MMLCGVIEVEKARAYFLKQDTNLKLSFYLFFYTPCQWNPKIKVIHLKNEYSLENIKNIEKPTINT
jgi:hypothetical protein